MPRQRAVTMLPRRLLRAARAESDNDSVPNAQSGSRGWINRMTIDGETNGTEKRRI